MNANNTHKYTKIDILPKDWKRFRLGDIVSINATKINPEISNSCPCIELEHLSQDTGQILGFVESSNQKSIKNSFQKGQILFGKLRPYLRKFWRAEFDGVCSSEIWVMSGKKVSNNFLFYLIQTQKFIQIANVSVGTKMPRADWYYMQEIPFFIPPLAEQEKIAQILGVWDKGISVLKSLIEAKTKRKKALMQRLLTPPKTSHTDFSSCHSDKVCHTEPFSCHTERSEVSKNKGVDFVDTLAFSNHQYDEVLDSCNRAPLCHTEGVARSIQKDDLQGNAICLDSSVASLPQNDRGKLHNVKNKPNESSLRFAEFTDKWQEMRLGDILQEKSIKNTSNVNSVLSVTNKQGFVAQKDYFEQEVASNDTSNYKVVYKDEFAYNPARINVGSIAMLEKFEIGILSPMYVVFKCLEKVDNCFFRYWLESHNFTGVLHRYLSGSVRETLSFNDMKTMHIFLPTLAEQKKIAQVLSACDKEIELLKSKFQCLKTQKKGLMQRLLNGEVRVKC